MPQAGDEEVSALKGGRRTLQEAESLRKVPKAEFVNRVILLLSSN